MTESHFLINAWEMFMNILKSQVKSDPNKGNIDKVMSIISFVLTGFSAVVLLACVLAITIFIIARAALDVSWMFIEEFTAYTMVLVSFFPLSYAFRTDGHIKVDVLIRMMPEKMKRTVEFITTLLSLIIIIYLTHKGILWFWEGVVDNVHSQYPSYIPLWPIYLIVPVGFAALSLDVILHIIRKRFRYFRGRNRVQ
jgi:TRAP-type C4-dicarboxylate transport system permease small subunit